MVSKIVLCICVCVLLLFVILKLHIKLPTYLLAKKLMDDIQ